MNYGNADFWGFGYFFNNNKYKFRQNLPPCRRKAIGGGKAPDHLREYFSAGRHSDRWVGTAEHSFERKPLNKY